MARSPRVGHWPARLASASALLLASSGCGGARTDGAAVAEVARPVAPPRGDLRVAAPGDSSAPRDLAVVLRLRNPEESVDAASYATGTPLSLALTVVMQIDDMKMLGAVDLVAPVDAAVLLPPPSPDVGTDESAPAPLDAPLAAVTFGVITTERFIAAFPRGAVSRSRRDGTVQIAHQDLTCSVPAARGPARVVCGSSVEALRRLSPWMTETLAREPLPSVDAQITFLAAPARVALRQLVASELREEAASARQELEQIGVADPELLSVPSVLLDEVEALAEDADRLDLALDLDTATRTASARVTARFRGASSWTARVLADPAERRGPPPVTFWRLPRDADAASWALSAHPRHFAGIRRVLAKAVSLGMSRAGATPDETAALVGVIDGFPTSGAAWASAQGRLPWKVPATGGATPQNAIADLKDRSRALLGWGVSIVDAPAAGWGSWLRDVDRAWKKGLAGLRRTAPHDPVDDAPELRVVRAPAGYPAGSAALDVVVKIDSELAWSLSPRLTRGEDGMTPSHPAIAPVRGSITLRVVVVPDGDRTILGWSLDDRALRTHVRAALKDAPASGTLAGRTDLERLDRPGTGGGFFSLRSWLDLGLDLASTPELARDEGVEALKKAVAAMPNGGATPILTFADGTTGTAPTLSVETLVQEGTIEDLRALGQHAIAQGIHGALHGMKKEETLQGPAGIVAPAPRPALP